MQFKVKLLSFNEPASDSSMIPRDVVEQWMASDAYKNAIASHSLLGTMSHYPRNASSGVKNLSSAITKTIGKDDLMIIVGESAPTHYITKLECGNDGWLYATAQLLDEKDFDSQAAENIKRLKGLLKSGCMIGCSAVILGYWDSAGKGIGGSEMLKKLVALKGFDLTLNPSWKKAQIVSVTDDEGNVIHSVEGERVFSDTQDEVTYDGMKVKCFSDLSQFGNVAKSSKINGQFTILKAKEFSSNNVAEFVDEGSVSNNAPSVETQKEFSVATIRERVRMAKFSPRMRMRRLFLEYKQTVRQLGGAEKIDEQTMKVLKSLFMSDVLDIFKQITPEILAGKQIATLTGASSLGKSVRVASQKLQQPARLAYMEMSKRGTLTPMRLKALQQAYIEFTKTLEEEVFSSNSIPEGLEKEVEQEEEKGN